jgi:hypothetical protein
MEHICPACGKQYDCQCKPEIIMLQGNLHVWFLACCEKCAQHLDALEHYLRTRGLG